MNQTNLKACPDCGKEVSKHVSVCPHCGRRSTALGTMFLGVVLAAILIWFIISLVHAGKEIEKTSEQLNKQGELHENRAR